MAVYAVLGVAACTTDGDVESAGYELVFASELQAATPGAFMIDLQRSDAIYVIGSEVDRSRAVVTCPSGVVMSMPDWITRFESQADLTASPERDFLMANGVLENSMRDAMTHVFGGYKCVNMCWGESNGATECGCLD